MNEKNAAEKSLVLIVDDNPEDVRIYRRMLERSGCRAWRVKDVSTGEEGLAFLVLQPVDCVLLDYRLPDMDGLEFLSVLNQQQKTNDFPVILLTGQGDEHVAVQAMKTGAADYLTKGSLSGDLLFRAISHAIDQTSIRKEQQRYYAFLDILIDTVPNPLFFKDRTERISGCNRAFEALVGKQKPEIVGRIVHDLFPQDLAVRFREMDEALFHDGSVQASELTVPDADGRSLNMICFLASFQEIDKAEKGLMGVLLDITSQKQTEAELRQTQKELEATVDQLRASNRQIIAQQKSVIEQERLKVLLQMAGATAHELNQPLTILLGSIELMRSQSKVDPMHLERIDDAGRKVSEIVRKIQQIRCDETMPYAGPDFIIRIDQPVTLLSIEDDEKDFELLKNLVSGTGNIKLLHAADQKQAFDLLRATSIDMIFIDYMLPDGTGLEFLESLRLKQLEIPVVMVTGQGNEVIASQSIQAGAYDYLPKSRLTAAALTRVIGNTLEKHRFKREMKRVTEKMARMACRDKLTGLYNRRYFDECLAREVEGVKRHSRQLALAIFDLDHFKNINDRYGHPAGDYVLRETGMLILRTIRKCDHACRYGGEEIAVIMPDTGSKDSVVTCKRILDNIRALPLEFEGKCFTVTASAGVASYDPKSEATMDQFVQTVDRLLYEAKASGRDRVVDGERIC